MRVPDYQAYSDSKADVRPVKKLVCAIPPLPDVDTSMILASQINEMKSPGYVSTDISDRRAMISLSAHKRHVEKSRSQARGVDLVQLEQPSYTKRVS